MRELLINGASIDIIMNNIEKDISTGKPPEEFIDFFRTLKSLNMTHAQKKEITKIYRALLKLRILTDEEKKANALEAKSKAAAQQKKKDDDQQKKKMPKK